MSKQPMEKTIRKMMHESNSSLFIHVPVMSEMQRAKAQVIIMDAFIDHVRPQIKSMEDLKAFVETYNSIKPCV